MKAKLIVVRTLQKHFLLKSVKIMVNSQMMGGQMDKNTTISCGNKYILTILIGHQRNIRISGILLSHDL